MIEISLPDMKIAINSSPFVSGHRARGTGTYTKELVESLEKYEKDHTYILFTQKIPEDADVVHYPYFDPFFLTLPLFQNKPTVVTVHDLIPIANPSHFPKGIRGEIKWQLQRASLIRSTRIITDSLASKHDINLYTGIPKEKLNVVYLAPSESYRRIKPRQLLEKVQKKYSLPDKFILYVGDINWNKNIPGLLKAFNEFNKLNAKSDTYLVLVGKAFLNNDLAEAIRINNLISELNISKRVIKPGYVPDADLPAIYNLASVYVQPSYAEGFGLPVLEAMACGVPVVSSSASSLKEIAGPSWLVSPDDSAEMAAVIMEALAADRELWFAKAEEWLKRFSWRKVVSETVKVYKQAVV